MLKVVLLLSLFSPLVLGSDEPKAFAEYEDDAVREVEISERLALDSCLGSTGVGQKVDAAYAKCFGAAYDIENMAEGEDEDEDGLSDLFQEKEVCFYKDMGWTDGSAVKEEAIKEDMKGLEAGLKDEFDNKVAECTTWNGGVRRKREAGLGLVSLVRREADPAGGEENKKKGKGKNKNGKKGKNKSAKEKKKGGKTVKKKSTKGKKKTGNSGKKKSGKNKKKNAKGKKDGRKGKKKSGKGKKKSGKGKNKSGKGKNKSGDESTGTGGISTQLYNQLWCVDLAFEQALQKCIENKIKG